MAKMKIEFLSQYYRNHSLPLKEKLIANLPRYAPLLKRIGFLANLRNSLPGLPTLFEKIFGFTRYRPLPAWRSDSFEATQGQMQKPHSDGVVLLVDTFNTYFEPDNARAALAVLESAGYDVHIPRPLKGGRPLCCGRTFLNAGQTDKAREELRRTVATLKSYVAAGMPVIGLEPSCLLTLRDELQSLMPGEDAERLAANTLLFEEFLAKEHHLGKLNLTLKPLPEKKALLHGHCHQKAFGLMGDVETVLKLVPELDVKTLDSGCCGMAGAFGYDADNFAVSKAMGEIALLPAVRQTDADTLIVTDGTSCRSQIRDLSSREGMHVARVLERALA